MFNIYDKYRHYILNRKLESILRLNNLQADNVVNAISRLVNDRQDPDEITWIEKIENVRAKLSNSPELLTIPDYGAGDPKEKFSEKQMQAGQMFTAPVSEICTYSKSRFWASLLFNLVRELKPETCIELGTCLGISTAYQAAALDLNRRGKMISMEGAETLASMSTIHMQQLGLTNASIVCGKFEDLLESTMQDNRPVDYAFIDGHHDEKATIRYFDLFMPYLSKKAVIIIDDISWSKGMRHAWEAISIHDDVKISIDLESLGICIFDENCNFKNSFYIAL